MSLESQSPYAANINCCCKTAWHSAAKLTDCKFFSDFSIFCSSRNLAFRHSIEDFFKQYDEDDDGEDDVEDGAVESPPPFCLTLHPCVPLCSSSNTHSTLSCSHSFKGTFFLLRAAYYKNLDKISKHQSIYKITV